MSERIKLRGGDVAILTPGHWEFKFVTQHYRERYWKTRSDGVRQRYWRKVSRTVLERRFVPDTAVRLTWGTGISGNRGKESIKLNYQEVVAADEDRDAVKARAFDRVAATFKRATGWSIYNVDESELNFEETEASLGDLGKWRSKVVYKGRDYVDPQDDDELEEGDEDEEDV